MDGEANATAITGGTSNPAGDAALAIHVDPRAIPLVLFTIVLLLLTRAPSARRWFAPPG